VIAFTAQLSIHRTQLVPFIARHFSEIRAVSCQACSILLLSLLIAPVGQAAAQSPQNVHSPCKKSTWGKPLADSLRIF